MTDYTPDEIAASMGDAEDAFFDEGEFFVFFEKLLEESNFTVNVVSSGRYLRATLEEPEEYPSIDDVSIDLTSPLIVNVDLVPRNILQNLPAVNHDLQVSKEYLLIDRMSGPFEISLKFTPTKVSGPFNGDNGEEIEIEFTVAVRDYSWVRY